jgi:uncharacterized protein YndB with AHSA1/START domain
MTTQRSVTIETSAGVVYALVSDPLRTSEWSPECVRCRWIGDSQRAEVGARFRGTSRNGRRRWSTTSEITEMKPNEVFAWEVTYMRLPVARWEYRIAPADKGVQLVESVDDRRGALLRRVSPWITGSPDRAARNADTMQETLLKVKRAAEQSATG